MSDPIRAELEALIAAYDEHGGMWPDEDVQALFAAVQRARTALAAESPAPDPRPQPVPGWQPIDTAPQDGTEILASDYDTLEIVSWNCEPSPWDSETGEGPAWCDREGLRMHPAWWQPLPDHPPIPQPPQGGEVEV